MRAPRTLLHLIVKSISETRLDSFYIPSWNCARDQRIRGLPRSCIPFRLSTGIRFTATILMPRWTRVGDKARSFTCTENGIQSVGLCTAESGLRSISSS